jgi:hypothetical protein
MRPNPIVTSTVSTPRAPGRRAKAQRAESGPRGVETVAATPLRFAAAAATTYDACAVFERPSNKQMVFVLHSSSRHQVRLSPNALHGAWSVSGARGGRE